MTTKSSLRENNSGGNEKHARSAHEREGLVSMRKRLACQNKGPVGGRGRTREPVGKREGM